MNIKLRSILKRKLLWPIIIFCTYFILMSLKPSRRRMIRDQSKIYKPGPVVTEPNYVTIVAMYFKLSESKHGSKSYDIWIENFLKSVSSPIVMYTDSESYKMILRMRSSLPIKLIIVNNIWDMMKKLEVERNREYIDNYMNRQNEIDPEKNIHNPNLYAIWNLKSYVTELVSRDNPFKSSFFMYVDAGAWRKGLTPNWPDTGFVKHVNNLLKDRILFGQINKIEDDPYSTKSDIIEGGFFSGSKNAIKKLSENFYDLHDEFLDKGLFIGKDQLMMKIMALVRNKMDIVRLETWDLTCDRIIDEWFFFIDFFSIENNYPCKNQREDLLINL